MFTRRTLLIIATALVLVLIAGTLYARHRRWSPELLKTIAQSKLRNGEDVDLSAARDRVAAFADTVPVKDARILIRKSERTLEILSGGKLLKSYPISLGGSPLGPKAKEGDLRTPEGEYYLCTRLSRSRFHLFLGVSYPAPEDLNRGVAVTKSQREAIIAAHEARTAPPWNTALGGAIGIHGGGSRGDWTLGCIALENDDVEELFLLTGNKTPVLILP